MNVDLLELAKQLSAVGFPTLLILVLIGNRFRIWVWGRELDAANAETEKVRLDYKERLATQVAETNEWKQLALRNLTVAQTMVNKAPTSGGA